MIVTMGHGAELDSSAVGSIRNERKKGKGIFRGRGLKYATYVCSKTP
jgi:hypothetical protein